jgi:hypothetical protein
MAATEGSVAQEMLTGSKYSVHTATFRSIKRARDLFLGDYSPFPELEPLSCALHLTLCIAQCV